MRIISHHRMLYFINLQRLLFLVLLLLKCDSSQESPLLQSLHEISQLILNDSNSKSYLPLFQKKSELCQLSPLDICTNILDKTQLGCYYGIKYLHNVRLLKGVLIIYEDPSKEKSCTTNTSITQLPHLSQSYTTDRTTDQRFTIPIRRVFKPFPKHKCKSYFNGTLHVFGRKHLRNIFHILNDHILPIMSQIILDLFIFPEYAELPRMHLNCCNNPPLLIPYIAPHTELYKLLFEGGEINILKVDNVCFRRVAWGTGVRLHYVDALVTLRRLTSDLARSLVLKAYHHHHHYHHTLPMNTPTPPPHPHDPHHQEEQKHSSKNGVTLSKSMSLSLVRDGRPLRIVYMSRGDSGLGRTLKNESVVIDTLTGKGGAIVSTCCDNGAIRSLSAQLKDVMHADVIIGLHGAGLVNAIFAPRGCILVELKTVYGYKSDLFLRTADARNGVYVHLSVSVSVSQYTAEGKLKLKQRYQYNPGVAVEAKNRIHVADEVLAQRILEVIVLALSIHDVNHVNNNDSREGGRIIKIPSTSYDDFIVTPSSTNGETGHLLGPPLNHLNDTCSKILTFARYREIVLKGILMEYCQPYPRDLSKFY
eukprot:gene369-673_t